jgi:hypothetical protein
LKTASRKLRIAITSDQDGDHVMILSIKRLFSMRRGSTRATRLSRPIGRDIEEARCTEAALRVLTLVGLVVLPISVQASALECPEVGRGAVPALIGDTRINRMTTGNNADLSAEIGGLIGRLRAENPRVSETDIANILIAAYCPVVAQKVASPAEKWQLMRQFDRVLMQQLAATATPPGSLIIANIPLPPAVYENLSGQAAAQGQTPTDFMAAILTRAGRP